ncbi:MAG: hypothetical protein ACREPX_15715 [Rhodanobacteraceae bacterium]
MSALALLCTMIAANADVAIADARTPLVDPSPNTPLQESWLEQKTTASDGASNTYYGTAAVVEGSTAVIGAYGDTNFTGAAYVLKKTGTAWTEVQKLTADDGLGGDEFGYRAVLAGSTLMITAFTATVGGVASQGAAYFFDDESGTWVQTQKLVADDGALFDNFGTAAAMYRDIAIIGAIGAMTGDSGPEGAAYVFKRAGTTWTQTQKLIADDAVAYDNFGFAAAISGNIAFVSAVTAAVEGQNGRGAVYVFARSNGTWSQVDKLTASDGASGDNFGSSIAFDGTTLLIGAPAHANRGAVYAFTDVGGTWTESLTLTADDGLNGDYFGQNIALKDSSVLIAADIATIEGDSSRGSGYLFRFAGNTWTQAHKFIASDGTVDDFLGAAIAYDGTTAILASPHPVIDGHAWQGAAYFYSRDTLFADGFDSALP